VVNGWLFGQNHSEGHGYGKNAQKEMLNFVMFVHTYLNFGVIINIVKTPNTLYSFFATPHKKKRKYLLLKAQQ